MKTSHVFRFLVLVVLVITTQKITAQEPPGVGVGINNPTGALLHVANPSTANMPSLRLDSTPTLNTATIKWFLAMDTAGRIVGKISANKDTLRKILGISDCTEKIIPYGYNNFNAGRPILAQYRNTRNMLAVYDPITFIFTVYIDDKYPKTFNLASYFSLPFGHSLTLNSVVIIDNNVYALVHYPFTGQRFLLKYDINNIINPPVIITFSGSVVLTNSTPLSNTPSVVMSFDGTYFYFNYACGSNITGDNNIAKYSLSGTNLNYISTINLSGAQGHVNNFLINPSNGFTTFSSLDQNLRRYTISGSNISFLQNFVSNALLNSNNCYYSYRLNIDSYYEIFYVE